MISEAKMKHILGVARKCERLSSIFVPPYLTSNYFLMGYLHDVGYEKQERMAHSARSYLYLTNFGVSNNNFLEAIKLHGAVVPFESITLEYAILVYSDLTTNYLGEDISIDDRISSIKERYGTTSDAYETSLIQKENLKAYFKIMAYKYPNKKDLIESAFKF